MTKVTKTQSHLSISSILSGYASTQVDKWNIQLVQGIVQLVGPSWRKLNICLFWS